jgi:Holliday junction DNA helicase RuvB
VASPHITSPSESPEDRAFEQNLRPSRFSEFVGQARVKENLSTYIAASKSRGDPALDHILFSGPPGVGKTTLAHIISRELERDLRATSGPVLDKAHDLAGILTKLGPGEILFVDEIHRMNKVVMEYLYSAMEDFHIDIVLDQGPGARSIKLNLERFTLVGATTREGILTGPFRDRFQIRERLGPYPPDDLRQIVLRSARIIGADITGEAADMIASRARGTPRVANRLLRRIRDVAEVKGTGRITTDMAEQGLGMLGIDSQGLEDLDRRFLQVLFRSGGRPVGLRTIAVAVDEEEDTLETVYEPYLIQMGFVQKTSRGRLATEKALRTYGEGGERNQAELF